MAEEQNNHHHHHHHHHEHGEHHHHHHHAIPQAVPIGANASYAGEVKQSAGPQKVGLGPGPYKVPTSLYKNNRDRLMNRFLSQDKSAFSIPGNGALFFQGGKEQYQYDTDMEMLFRQESFFYWLFGINEPNVFGVLDLQSLESLLFVPRLGAEYELWAGKVPTKEEYKAKYGVDHVFYEDEMVEILKKRGIEVLHVISGKNSDSGNTFAEPDFPGIDKFKVDKNLLYWHIVECRVRKTPEEIDLLRYVVGISSEAHIEVMKQVRPGMHEYQLEGIFKGDCIYRGACRYTAYTCICCTGQSGSVLHYGHAGAPLEKKIQEHEMLLLDMGADYQGYCADITCSYPANGKFTADQREVYEMVLAAQQAVIAAMKPGILWPDMHRLAERVILEHLVKHNFVLTQGKTLDELHKLYIPTIFFPHGLGHMLGLDVHDVGGYPPGVERSKEPGIARLRTGRILEEGMVLTVEPGVYFIEANIKRALENPAQKPHLNMDKISRFMNFGGVRLEDDVVVTKNGVENLTKCPRTVEEIEKVMARS